MMKRIASLVMAAVLMLSLTACGGTIKAKDGLGQGKVGDTFGTYFFDFKVNSAYVADTYEGYTPADGNQVLVANVTVKNTTKDGIAMYDTDFWLEWEPQSEDNFAWPVTTNPDTGEEIETVSANQLPFEYALAAGEERTGDLVFELPAGTSIDTTSFWYLEMFDDGTEEGTTGDYFAVTLSESK